MYGLGQLSRIKECERMLVAMEMAGWLNDTSLVLQAVVQTYGLIAPLIQTNIMALSVLQVSLLMLRIKGLHFRFCQTNCIGNAVSSMAEW